MQLTEKELGLPWHVSWHCLIKRQTKLFDVDEELISESHERVKFAAVAANNHHTLLRALKALHAAARDLSTRHEDHIAAMNEAARVLREVEDA